MSIKLYDLVGKDHSRPFSPHCWKVKMALAHKGLAFTSVPTTFTQVPNVENGISPLIPVISDKGKIVWDSFQIALYLERTYPDRPTLFAGEGGEAMARFVERWSQLTIHPFLSAAALVDIHDRLEPVDQKYFRESREARFDRPLEDMPVDRDEKVESFRKTLEPMRNMLGFQPFIGGKSPLFADYIVFGALQWVRIMSPFQVLEASDPIHAWFERCLALHGGLGAKVSAAA